jgi:hypothetical protein
MPPGPGAAPLEASATAVRRAWGQASRGGELTTVVERAGGKPGTGAVGAVGRPGCGGDQRGSGAGGGSGGSWRWVGWQGADGWLVGGRRRDCEAVPGEATVGRRPAQQWQAGVQRSSSKRHAAQCVRPRCGLSVAEPPPDRTACPPGSAPQRDASGSHPRFAPPPGRRTAGTCGVVGSERHPAEPLGLSVVPVHGPTTASAGRHRSGGDVGDVSAPREVGSVHNVRAPCGGMAPVRLPGRGVNRRGGGGK